jgi:hypothetical protein
MMRLVIALLVFGTCAWYTSAPPGSEVSMLYFAGLEEKQIKSSYTDG